MSRFKKENPSEEKGFHPLQTVRLKHKKSLIGHLNLNSLKQKLPTYHENSVFGLSCTSETKIDESFPTTQFYVEGYEIRAIHDQDTVGV